MPDSQYIQKKTGVGLVKLVLIGMLVQMAVIVVGWVMIHGNQVNDRKRTEQARLELIDSQRSGCERGKLDRSANASGWRTAQTARLSAVAKELEISFVQAQELLDDKPQTDDLPDLIAARRYERIATPLEKRSMINCKEAFP